MANQEEILDALCSYEKKPSSDIPPVLEDFLRQVAKTGETIFPWPRLKPLFIRKLDQVIEQFNREVPFDHLAPYPNVENAKYEEVRSRVIDAFEKFSGPPFTVQRLCELVTEPRKHYQRSDKFLRGVEKNVMVVSTVDPYGKKISSESPRNLMNGLEMNGFGKPRDDGDGPVENPPFPNLPPTAWSETGSVATVWPSVFPEQTLVEQNTSANAILETDENKTEMQSTEVATSLDKLLCDKTDKENIDTDKSGTRESLDSDRQDIDSNVDSVNSETLEQKDEIDNTVNTGEVLHDKQSDSEDIQQHDSSEKETDSDQTVEQTDSDQTVEHSAGKVEANTEETNLREEVQNKTETEVIVTDTAITDTELSEQENTQEKVQDEGEKCEVVKEEAETVSQVSNMVSEERPPSPETTDGITEAVSGSPSENIVESSKEEESYADQSEQSSHVIHKDDTESESVCQSSTETASHSTEFEADQSKTVGVVEQPDSVATQNEAIPQNEPVAGNEAVTQKEAESEEMEASSSENTVMSSETCEVKDSEEISSSEGMDVDSGKLEASEESEVVSTSDQGTEEPMEQE